MVKKMLSTFRSCCVIDDMTNTYPNHRTLLLWPKFNIRQNCIIFEASKINTMDSISSYFNQVMDGILHFFFFFFLSRKCYPPFLGAMHKITEQGPNNKRKSDHFCDQNLTFGKNAGFARDITKSIHWITLFLIGSMSWIKSLTYFFCLFLFFSRNLC